MIRIIKDGKKPIKTKTIWQFKCPECGCDFECEIEDFKAMERNGFSCNKIIDCPYCGKELRTNRDFYKTHEVEVVPVDQVLKE